MLIVTPGLPQTVDGSRVSRLTLCTYLSATASAVGGIPGESDFSASPSMPRRSRKMERSSSRGAHCGRAGRVVDDRGYSNVMPSASLRYVAQSTVLPSGSSTSVGLGVGEEDAVAEATAAEALPTPSSTALQECRQQGTVKLPPRTSPTQ